MAKAPKSFDLADDAPLTADELRRMRPSRDVVPEIVSAYEAGTLRYPGQRGAQKKPTKQATTLRLDKEVLTALRATGAGWQTRANAMLRAAMGVGQ